MSQTGIKYLPETRSLGLDSEGFIVTTTDSTPDEVAARINSEINSYLFDESFGCSLFTFINKKNNNISNNSIKLAIIDSLTPMIEQGKISSDITVVSFVGGALIQVKIVVRDISGNIIYSNFVVF